MATVMSAPVEPQGGPATPPSSWPPTLLVGHRHYLGISHRDILAPFPRAAGRLANAGTIGRPGRGEPPAAAAPTRGDRVVEVAPAHRPHRARADRHRT